MLNLQLLQMEVKFGRFYKKVWPLSPRKWANFTEKTPGNYKKVWPSFDELKMPDAEEEIWIEERCRLKSKVELSCERQSSTLL
jgi:hypothetical protein